MLISLTTFCLMKVLCALSFANLLNNLSSVHIGPKVRKYHDKSKNQRPKSRNTVSHPARIQPRKRL